MSPQSGLPIVPIASAFSISPRVCGFLTAASMRFSSSSLIDLFQMIARKRWIYLRAPGVDATAQTSDFLEAMTLKIRGRVHAARALVIVNHEQIGARPVGQDFLHEFLSEEVRAWELYGIEFLACPNVKKVNRFPGRE